MRRRERPADERLPCMRPGRAQLAGRAAGGALAGASHARAPGQLAGHRHHPERSRCAVLAHPPRPGDYCSPCVEHVNHAPWLQLLPGFLAHPQSLLPAREVACLGVAVVGDVSVHACHPAGRRQPPHLGGRPHRGGAGHRRGRQRHRCCLPWPPPMAWPGHDACQRCPLPLDKTLSTATERAQIATIASSRTRTSTGRPG